MPRLKAATDANGTKFYPVTITKGVYDIDNNQKLSDTLTAIQNDTEKIEKFIGVDTAYEYVDLGLPSGALWAKCNIGATSEEETGLYFQWGDSQGYTASDVGSGTGQKYFGWRDYKYNSSGTDSPNITKYNFTDNKTALEASDDAIKFSWDAVWRMPTADEFDELLDNSNCSRVWQTDYNNTGVCGYLFTSLRNGNTLFLPASGLCERGRVFNANINGGYWSKNLSSSNKLDAFYLRFTKSTCLKNDNGRCYGYSIRGVLCPMDNKADKVPSAIEGNFAGLDSQGNLTDSGKNTSDFAPIDSVLYPVDESTLTTSATFEEGNILAVNGKIYKAEDDTSNMPFTPVKSNSSFVYVEIGGVKGIVIMDETPNTGWQVWADASEDVKIRDVAESIASGYLPLSAGDTKSLTGDLYTSNDIFVVNSVGRKFGIKKSLLSNGAAGNIDVGWDWTNKDGSGAFFRNADFNSTVTINGVVHSQSGCFGLYARNADSTNGFSSQLMGFTDGTLIWDSSPVITERTGDERYIKLSDTVTINETEYTIMELLTAAASIIESQQ